MSPKRRTDVKLWPIEDEGVVYDPASGMGHVLNSTALRIWSMCDGDTSADDIRRSLATQFPDRAADIDQDVPAALRELCQLGLLVTSA